MKKILFLLCVTTIFTEVALAVREGFTKPFLTSPKNNQITISYSSVDTTGGAVVYRKKGDAESKTKVDALGGIAYFSCDHQITLKDLASGDYEYNVYTVNYKTGLVESDKLIDSGKFTILEDTALVHREL